MAYFFRQAYDSGAFLQRDLLPHDDFAKEARKRDLEVPAFREGYEAFLEALDRVGYLSPLAFTVSERYTQVAEQPLFGRTELIFREERDFTAWDKHRFAERDESRPVLVALYSPWQLLLLTRVLKHRYLRVAVDEVLSDHALTARLGDIAQKKATLSHESLARFNTESRLLLLLLVRIQNRYWPSIGPFSFAFDPKRRDYIDPVPRERRQFRARQALEELELTVDQVHDYYERLSYFGQQDDPIPDWWILRRVASRSEREAMKGPARRVEDFWEAVQALKLFYRALTRKVLPDANAVGTDPRWQRHVLGRGPRLYYDQADLRRFLVRHDLYPHQVEVFVEGASEEAFLRRMLTAWLGPLGEWGIRITDLHGKDTIGGQQHALLQGLAYYARSAVVIVDREGEAARYVRGLVRDRVIAAEGIFLWDKNFEEDNWSDAELAAAARRLAKERSVSVRGLSGHRVRQSFEDRQGRPGAAPTFVDELRRLAASGQYGKPLRFSKLELAAILAELALEELANTKLETVSKKRPIVDRASVIVQLAHGARFQSAEEEGG